MSVLKQYPLKYSRSYRCPDNIKNFKIRIKLKQIDDVKKTILRKKCEDWPTKTFHWQEKILSKSERKIQENENKAESEKKSKRNKDNEEGDDESSEKIEDIWFTYVNEDKTVIDSFETINNNVTQLQMMVENLEINDDYMENASENYFDMEKSILKNMKNPIVPKKLEIMYIAADFGDMVDNTWIKNEYPVCTLKYDKNSKTIAVYPDFTASRPYRLRIKNLDSFKEYYYFIENGSEKMNEELINQEAELIKKLLQNKTSTKSQIVGKKFYLPPKNKLQVHIFFEILSAKNFEYPNVYVQYFIDLPENWKCPYPEKLKGVSQVCFGKMEEKFVHFGFDFDVILEFNIQENKGLPKTPYIYFEIFSKERWDVFRTEGVCYRDIPVNKPGQYLYDLNCFRLVADRASADLRRFFIGDCSNYENVTWIGVPDQQEDEPYNINKYGTNTIGTGCLNVRMNVVCQSQAFLKEYNEDQMGKREKLIFEKLNSSTLIQSVDQVLMAFRRARKRMREARKDL